MVIGDRRWDVNALMSATQYRQAAIALSAFGVQPEPGDERFPVISANWLAGRLKPAPACGETAW